MKMHVKEKFTFAVNGYTITHFNPQDNDEETGTQDVPDDAAAYALKEDFADEVVDGKSVAKSPENKARNGKGKGK